MAGSIPAGGGASPAAGAGMWDFIKQGANAARIVGTGLLDHQTARVQASMQRAAIAHQNYMTALAASQSTNVVNLNEIAALDAGVRQQEQLQVIGLQQQGKAEVAAGAAGVEGGSVDAVMRNLIASEAKANYTRISTMRGQFRAFNQDRRNIEMQKAFGRNTTVVSQPSGLAAIMGIGQGLIGDYNKRQPNGQKLEDMSFQDVWGKLFGGTRGRS